jgi:hypothetical protein
MAEEPPEIDEAIVVATDHAREAEEQLIETPTPREAVPLAHTVEHFAEDIDVLAREAAERAREK